MGKCIKLIKEKLSLNLHLREMTKWFIHLPTICVFDHNRQIQNIFWFQYFVLQGNLTFLIFQM